MMRKRHGKLLPTDLKILRRTRAAETLLESISESQIGVIDSAAKGPAQIWQKLHEKITRQSEAARSAAQRAP